MKEHKSYLGKLNGVSCVWCDKKPNGFKVVKENLFYTPDEGKVFTKDGELFDIIFIRDESVKIEDYEEVDKPEETME